MAFSLVSLFKRKPVVEAAPAPPPMPVAKPDTDRFSKTVLPNATRPAISPDAFKSLAPGSSLETSMPLPHPISMLSSKPAPTPLPPAVAFALTPNVERVMPFALSDVLAHIPPEVVRPLSQADGDRRILLKATELERGMANGKPTASLSSIFQQVPEIFVKPIEAGDPSQVALPFTKVLEQFANMQQRNDQFHDQIVPQVETPFLKVTLEDDEKFGTSIGPVSIEPMGLPVRVLPATAESIAAAEPEPAETFVPQARVPSTPKIEAPTIAAPNPSFSPNANGNGNESGLTNAAPASAPTRIPFKLTPNGTGVSAAERVPASTGGASVPTSFTPLPPPPAPSAPAVAKRIPFSLGGATAAAAATTEAPDKPADGWITKDSFSSDDVPVDPPTIAPSAKRAEATTKISLPLKPILNALPPFQLVGEVRNVPDAARIELPFALVEPQLASGRVNIETDDFAAALPEEFRPLFSAKEIAAPVGLPLQDVLTNLPAQALRMRDDQEEQERGVQIATPFSRAADEDAKRFKIAAAPIALPISNSLTSESTAPASRAPEGGLTSDPVAPAAPDAGEEKPVAPVAADKSDEPEAPVEVKTTPKPLILAPAARSEARPSAVVLPPKRNALQQEFDTDETIDAKAAVTFIEKIAGVQACAITFADGLNLAGKFPDAFSAEGLCAMAPSIVQRVENHLVDTTLGSMRGLTVTGTAASVTFFMHKNLCLAVLHASGDLAADVRVRLDRIVQELAKTYSQPV